MLPSLLGLTLDAALEKISACGMPEPEIQYTRAPRGEAEDGTLRVVRVSSDGKVLTAARFPDRVKEKA